MNKLYAWALAQTDADLVIYAIFAATMICGLVDIVVEGLKLP